MLKVITPVRCPYCGNLCAVQIEEADSDGNGIQFVRCDDPQDGGCDKLFCVAHKLVVKTLATKLHEFE